MRAVERQIIRAQERVWEAEAKAAEARRALARAIDEANAAGASMDSIGRWLGVSRQRVAQLKQRSTAPPSAAEDLARLRREKR
jgi:hypothetical protein